MKILFSPSESKNSGGDERFKKEELLFGNIRDEILNEYQSIMHSKDIEKIVQLTGAKRDYERYMITLDEAPVMDAIERYSGVAYDYLSYSTLSKEAKDFIKNSTVIFSNLFGPLRGGDKIPEYKVEQTHMVGSISPEIFYREKTSKLLDSYLEDEEILDLRAGYYDKFYKPNKHYTTLKFLKNNKVVSHWAKAYRGIVLKEIAKHNVYSIEKLHTLEIDKLVVKEILEQSKKTTIIYEILD